MTKLRAFIFSLQEKKPATWVFLIWGWLTIFFFISRLVYYSEKPLAEILYSAVGSATFGVVGILAAKAYLELVQRERRQNPKTKVALHLAFATLLAGIALFRLTFDELSDISIHTGTDLIIVFLVIIIILYASYGFLSFMWCAGRHRKNKNPFFPKTE